MPDDEREVKFMLDPDDYAELVTYAAAEGRTVHMQAWHLVRLALGQYKPYAPQKKVVTGKKPPAKRPLLPSGPKSVMEGLS
jgi:hypothetical protein